MEFHDGEKECRNQPVVQEGIMEEMPLDLNLKWRGELDMMLSIVMRTMNMVDRW